MNATVKHYIDVRHGACIRDRHSNEWRPNVRELRRPDYWRVIVTLDCDLRSVIVACFDVHTVADYGGSESDHRSVHLSALGHACAVAARLESLEDWELSAHIGNLTR